MSSAGQFGLTASVIATAPGSGAPTGNVQFVDTSNSAVVASASLVAGKASATIATSGVSAMVGRPIVAVYAGDSNFKASISAALPAVVNAAANWSSTSAPDEIASVFGMTGLSGDTPATLPLGTSLGGVQVNITDSAGVVRPALLYGVFASAGQINFLIPGGTAAGLGLVTITLPGGGTVTMWIDVAAIAPGVFTANATGHGPYAGQVVYVHADGSQNVVNAAASISGSSDFGPNPIQLGGPGDQVYLVLYGTGLRHGGSLTATVNGTNVPVAFFGAQGSDAGLDQINLGPLPASLAGAGIVNLILTADGQAANTVTVAIQ